MSDIEMIQPSAVQTLLPSTSHVAAQDANALATNTNQHRLNREFLKYTEGTPKFSGDELQYQSWERTIKRKIEHWELSDSITHFDKLNFALGTLEGATVQWQYNFEDKAQASNTVAFPTMNEFFKQIAKEFDIKNKVDKAFNYLWSLKPAAMNIQLYLTVFSVHINNAEPLSEQFKIRLFINGLHPLISSRLKLLQSGNKDASFAEVKLLAHTAQTEHDYEVSILPIPQSPKKLKLEAKEKVTGMFCDKCKRNNHNSEDCRAKTMFKAKARPEAASTF